MSLSPKEYAQHILEAGSLQDKLLSPQVVDFDKSEPTSLKAYSLPRNPGRDKTIQFSSDQVKFPKRNQFHRKDQRALALHFFANHELLAIEMMAAAILCLPTTTDDELKLFKTLLSTIEDEQKHFKLYLKRLSDFGGEFGAWPLNDFFWRQMEKIKSFEQFYALMALTFEGANLDFADFYREVFYEVEDTQSAELMQIVLEDEIKHVAFGHTWLQKWKLKQNDSSSFWEYYINLLPELITPARAKGSIFCSQHRIKAGLSQGFIDQLLAYKGDFAITQRKQW